MSVRVPQTTMRILVFITIFNQSASSLGAAQQADAAEEEEKEEEEEPKDTARFVGEDDLFNELSKAISATRREEPVARAPSSIAVIEKEDLQRQGVRYLSDALRIVPGLEVMRTSSTESNVSTRTYNDTASTAQGTLALVDGRLAYNDFFGNVLWDALPVSLQGVERIEVIRGPGSFVYGPNAMHGLVNVFTRSPLDYEQDVVSFSAGLGTYDSATSSLTYVRRSEDTALKTTLVWDDVDQFDGGSDANTRDKRFGEIRFAHRLDEDEVIELTGGVSEQKLDLLLPELQALIPAQVLSNDVREAFVKANYTQGNLKTQLSWIGFDSTSGGAPVYRDFSVELDTVDLDLQYSHSVWEGHTTTVGAGYRYATFATHDLDVSRGRHDTGLAWGFAQDEFDLGEDVSITAGVRLDHHTVAGSNVSPRVAAVWELKEQQYLRASAGSGFRNPSLRELWFDMPLTGFPVTVRGNEDLDAEQIRSFELAYLFERGAVLPRLKASVNAYYNLIDELIVFQLDPIAGEIVPENSNDEEAFGFEAEVDYLVNDTTSVFANYSWGEQRDRDTGEINQMNPRHKANAGVRRSTPDGFSAMLWASYFDETRFSGVTVDEYVIVNGSVSKTFTMGESRGRLFLDAFNLLGNDHREHPDGQSYGMILQAGLGVTW